MHKLLIIDDNEHICHILSDYGKHEGFDVYIAKDGLSGLKQFNEIKPSIILLDLMLPDISGFDICQTIRLTSAIPILMITAAVEAENQIYGLDHGADDYIFKPFNPKAVFARIRAVLRRSDSTNDTLIKLMDLEVDLKNQTAKIGSVYLSLTSTEIKLLHILCSDPKRVYTRDNLLDLVYGPMTEANDRVIDSHMKRLRQKLDKIDLNPIKIKTVWGLGYKLEYEGN